MSGIERTPYTWAPNTLLPPEIAAPLRAAVAILPQEHLDAPTDGETFGTKEDGVIRCSNFAFAWGFCLVTVKSDPHHIRLGCIHHGQETRNTRHLTEADRAAVDDNGNKLRRPNRPVGQTACKFALRIAFKP